MSLDHRIQTRAYFHAENKSGTSPDDPVSNWLQAEKEELSSSSPFPGPFRFRLTFHARYPGIVNAVEEALTILTADGIALSMVARDSDSLAGATRFHLQAGGFETPELARKHGERARARLHIANAILGLGLTIPSTDVISSRWAAEKKRELLEQQNIVLLDSMVGLDVQPDDDRFMEFIVSASLTASPSDPLHILSQLRQLWEREFDFDEAAGSAIEILSRASAETSSRTRFLLTYFACEQLVECPERSTEAQKVIRKLQEIARNSDLPKSDGEALASSIGNLTRQSFRLALKSLVARVQSPPTILEMPLGTFLEKCVKTRNQLAHQSTAVDNAYLDALSSGLKTFVLLLIWSRHALAPLQLDQATTNFSMSPGQFTVRAR